VSCRGRPLQESANTEKTLPRINPSWSFKHVEVLVLTQSPDFINDRTPYPWQWFLVTPCTQTSDNKFLLRDADMHSAYLLQRRGWVAGWVSVIRRYCIKTTKPILKLFQPSGSPIILVSSNTLIGSKPHPVYRMVPLSMTSSVSYDGPRVLMLLVELGWISCWLVDNAASLHNMYQLCMQTRTSVKPFV